jgi:hypothetical protein
MSPVSTQKTPHGDIGPSVEINILSLYKTIVNYAAFFDTNEFYIWI